MIASCALDAQDEAIGGDGIGAGDESFESGKADAAADALSTRLRTKYGLRPRRYTGLFNDSNIAEERFTAALPVITTAINQRAQARGAAFRFTQAEIATNFISEGGFTLLAANQADSDPSADFYINGWNHLGTDSIVANATAVGPWLSPTLRALVADTNRHISGINERNEPYTTIWVDTIEQGIELNAAMFAWSRDLAAAKIADEGTAWADVAPEARFFWSTVWFNAGPGLGESQVEAHGVDYWQTRWTRGDDHEQFSRFLRYNALWRTSSWEFMTELQPTLAE
ncbi:MAG: hypothetical protein ACKV2T_34630 [Kofleriaceae bacterium]